MLALLVLPLGGIAFTVFSGAKPERTKARAEKAAARSAKAKPEKEKAESPLEPPTIVETAPTFVTISGNVASSRTGLSGHLWWKADEGGSNITNPCGQSTCLADKGAKLCAKGKALGFSKKRRNLWGAALGWNLREDESGIHTLGKSKIKGLSFVFEPDGANAVAASAAKPTSKLEPLPGKPAPEPLAKPSHEGHTEASTDGYRFAFRVGDTDYCTTLRPGKARVQFKDLRKNCDGMKKGPKLSEALIQEGKYIKWEVPSPHSGKTHFNFCISELKTM